MARSQRMHRAFLLLVLARAGAPTGPPGECEVPSWWYADEAARSSEDDALAALEARWSARRAACPISGAHTLACPPGAVLVDAWVEARTNGTTKVLAPAPFDVYGCFGGDQCRLPTAHVCAGASAPSNVSTTVAISGECATSEAVREASIAQAGAPSPASAPAATGEQDEADDHIIPLFEWKERMLARLAEQATHHATQHEGAAEGGAQAGEVNGGPAAAEGTDGAPTADAGAQNATGRPTAPPAGAATLPPSGPARIRLPLSQRFNYGSFDAGARLVTANPEAKGANDILRADKDKYMLSPCAARKWVVIALPEDIKVDAISLSNRELFSSSVREFQLLGSMKYPTDLWFELGKFEAQDTKHVQEFYMSTPNWARFLKLRLISHHRAEHYCTLSSVAIYGQTVMDDFSESMELQEQQMEVMRQRMTSAASGAEGAGAEAQAEVAAAAHAEAAAAPANATERTAAAAEGQPTAEGGAGTDSSVSAEHAPPGSDEPAGYGAESATSDTDGECSGTAAAAQAAANAGLSVSPADGAAARGRNTSDARVATGGRSPRRRARSRHSEGDGCPPSLRGAGASAPGAQQQQQQQPPPQQQQQSPQPQPQPQQLPQQQPSARTPSGAEAAHAERSSGAVATGDAAHGATGDGGLRSPSPPPSPPSAEQPGGSPAAAHGGVDACAEMHARQHRSLPPDALAVALRPEHAVGMPLADVEASLNPDPMRGRCAVPAGAASKATAPDAADAMPVAETRPVPPNDPARSVASALKDAAAAVAGLWESVVKPHGSPPRPASAGDGEDAGGAGTAPSQPVGTSSRDPPSTPPPVLPPEAQPPGSGPVSPGTPRAAGSSSSDSAESSAVPSPAPAPAAAEPSAANGTAASVPAAEDAVPGGSAGGTALGTNTSGGAGIGASGSRPAADAQLGSEPNATVAADGTTGVTGATNASSAAAIAGILLNAPLPPPSGAKEGVLKALTTQVHTLELNVSLTSLWLTEFNTRNNATLSGLREKLARARENITATSERVRALEESQASRLEALEGLKAELAAIDSQLSLLVATIERQSALHAHDIAAARAGARRELVCGLLVALGIVACMTRAREPSQARASPPGPGATQGGEPVAAAGLGVATADAPPSTAYGRVWGRFIRPRARSAGRGIRARPNGAVPQTHSIDNLRDVASLRADPLGKLQPADSADWRVNSMTSGGS